MRELLEKHCRELPPGTPALPVTAITRYLAELPGWSLASDGQRITKNYEFKNFHETMEFVNALAWVVHREDHHPDLEVSYKRCRVVYSTHSVGGVSENDVICAAKIEALLR
ncbi:MAG TPA: 4a-hydroxytetrahydrobiopterin dehydratase [Polyangiaceae bacterium]|nr:4a-hydroxytetrahydrobiopterin dehydratase [Polyangiaceae bacterium]